jgi:hypothetical protein
VDPDHRRVPPAPGGAHDRRRQRRFPPAWIDSLLAANVIHHSCSQIAVADCPDSASAAYVGFSQPRLATDRSADVDVTIVVMNPASCGHHTAQATEETGRLHMPWVGSTLASYRWTREKSLQARC